MSIVLVLLLIVKHVVEVLHSTYTGTKYIGLWVFFIIIEIVIFVITVPVIIHYTLMFERFIKILSERYQMNKVASRAIIFTMSFLSMVSLINQRIIAIGWLSVRIS